MTLSLKKSLAICSLAGVLLSSTVFAGTDSFITKTYELIFKSRTISTETLVYKGEIYVKLSDYNQSTGLTSSIAGDTITFSEQMGHTELHPDASGNLYSGALKNGLPHGSGTLYLKSGGKYEGQWVNGLYDGKGTLILANGNIYTGEFSQGFIHGEGQMLYPDGSYYKGQHAHGIREGFGLLYYDKDNKYEGFWANGLRNGKGKAYIEGRYKKGLWNNNKMIKTLPESSFGF